MIAAAVAEESAIKGLQVGTWLFLVIPWLLQVTVQDEKSSARLTQKRLIPNIVPLKNMLYSVQSSCVASNVVCCYWVCIEICSLAILDKHNAV